MPSGLVVSEGFFKMCWPSLSWETKPDGKMASSLFSWRPTSCLQESCTLLHPCCVLNSLNIEALHQWVLGIAHICSSLCPFPQLQLMYCSFPQLHFVFATTTGNYIYYHSKEKTPSVSIQFPLAVNVTYFNKAHCTLWIPNTNLHTRYHSTWVNSDRWGE